VDDEANKPRIGRPTRAMQSALALAGVALDSVDPVAVLQAVAGDTSQPGTARVAAARALLAHAKDGGLIARKDREGDLNARAIALMRTTRAN
jgi:hypothetical protein